MVTFNSKLNFVVVLPIHFRVAIIAVSSVCLLYIIIIILLLLLLLRVLQEVKINILRKRSRQILPFDPTFVKSKSRNWFQKKNRSRGNPSSKSQSRRRDTAVRSDKRSTVKGTARRCVGKPHCTHCGRSEHQKGDRCPAKDATCHKCNRKGHYQSQCFSKTVAATTSEQ